MSEFDNHVMSVFGQTALLPFHICYKRKDAYNIKKNVLLAITVHLFTAAAVLRLYVLAGRRSTIGKKTVSRVLLIDCRKANRNLTLSTGTPEKQY
jgi:hypothetical protein